MDEKQLEKRFDWIEEELRSEREITKQSGDKLDSLENQLESLSSQIKDLTSEVSRLAALSSRIHQMDEVLSNHRVEVSRQLEASEERRSAQEKQIEELRKADQRSLAKNLDGIQKELDRLSKIEQTLANRQEEEIRISRVLGELELENEKINHKIESFEQTVFGFEDGRNQDNRRTQEFELEVKEIRKGLDRTRGDLEAVDDRARRNEIRNAELSAAEKERNDAQQSWIENQGMKLVEFDKNWQAWEKRFGEIEKLATDFDERLKVYEETYRVLQQMKSDLDKVIEKLERRISEVSEMHRLAEEKSKQDWSAFQADDMKRWNTFKLSNDEQWREHDRTHANIANDTEKLHVDTARLIEGLDGMTMRDQTRLNELLSLINEWFSEGEES